MPEELSRRHFIESLAALAGVALLSSCGHETPSEAVKYDPLHPEPASANNDGSVTVPGAGRIKAGQAVAFLFPNGDPGVVFMTSAGKRGALSAKCTHAGCTVEWRPKAGQDVLDCPCHGSQFEPDGAVIHGPAKRGLLRYKVNVIGADAILRMA